MKTLIASIVVLAIILPGVASAEGWTAPQKIDQLRVFDGRAILGKAQRNLACGSLTFTVDQDIRLLDILMTMLLDAQQSGRLVELYVTDRCDPLNPSRSIVNGVRFCRNASSECAS